MFENRFPLRDRKTRIAAATLATLAIAGAAVAVASPNTLKSTTALTKVSFAAGQAAFQSLPELRVSPAVVNIQVTKTAGRPMTAAGPDKEFRRFFDEDFMKRFFGEEMMKRFGHQYQRRDGERSTPMPGMQAQGSGFIVDKDGYIVTNHHVVDGAGKITVTLKNGDKHEAKLIGGDAKTDLALIKIETDGELPVVKFGDSSKVRVGEPVIAIGNPFGLGHTATTGIVSARGRSIGAGPYDDFLQIDAPINQGNSGGPTFNLKGEVIGVNTAIVSPSGGNVGIGFAIPSAMVKEVIADLKDDGKIVRGWLGVTIQEVTDDIAKSLDLDKARGAIVSGVMPGSPAAKAELRQGDVILGVNGLGIDKFRDLPRVIAMIKPGENVELDVWRQGKTMSLSAMITEMAETKKVAAASKSDVLGMHLARLDSGMRDSLGLGKDVEGVAILDVDADSPAAEKGLRKGDVIVRVGNTKVSDPASIVAGVKTAKLGNKKAVLLLVIREAQKRFVALPLRNA